METAQVIWNSGMREEMSKVRLVTVLQWYVTQIKFCFAHSCMLHCEGV